MCRQQLVGVNGFRVYGVYDYGEHEGGGPGRRHQVFPWTRETTVPRACDVEETGCPTPDSQQRWIPNGCMQLKMIARVLRGHIFTHNNIIP